MSIWFAIGTLIGYGVDFHAKTAAGRILTVGVYIVSVVLISAYQANLTANLTLSKAQDFISGIDDIKNGKLPISRVGIIGGSSLEDYFLREISGGSRNYYLLKSKEDMFDKLLNKVIDASIMDAGVLEYAVNGVYCNLTVVGTGFDHSAFGIIYPKKWLHEQILDVTILSLREFGVFEELKSKWFQTNYCADSSAQNSSDLPFESLADLFIVFGVISFCSIIVFLWYKRCCFVGLLSKKRHRTSDSDPMILLSTTPNLSFSAHVPFTRPRALPLNDSFSIR
ncbi:hypothetical protein I4U23_023199 [Adineta vaga]|nr:hypothetical protein I4U23_023199 [Adineta vaga]